MVFSLSGEKSIVTRKAGRAGGLARGGQLCGVARFRRSPGDHALGFGARMPFHLKSLAGQIRCAYFFGATQVK